MADPVVLSDGFSYERAAIEKWLRDRSASPMSNAPLTMKVGVGTKVGVGMISGPAVRLSDPLRETTACAGVPCVQDSVPIASLPHD